MGSSEFTGSVIKLRVSPHGPCDRSVRIDHEPGSFLAAPESRECWIGVSLGCATGDAREAAGKRDVLTALGLRFAFR